VIETDRIWENVENLDKMIISLGELTKLALISLEEYHRPFDRLDVMFGITSEVHVCDFCLRDVIKGEVVYHVPDMLSCISLLRGFDICISCFQKRASGKEAERLRCENCGFNSIIDTSGLKGTELLLRERFCSKCRNRKPPCFYVSSEELLFWKRRERETNAEGRVNIIPGLNNQSFDILLDYYNWTREQEVNSKMRFCRMHYL